MLDGGMGHDRLEAAMFWVGALLAFLPLLILLAVLGWVRRQKKRAAQAETAESGPANR